MGLMSKVYQKALAYLARREYAAYELKQKLLQKGFDELDVDEAIFKCQSQGYQSDQRYAESLMRVRLAQGIGEQRFRQELHQVQLNENLIEKILLEYRQDSSEQIARVWQKKFKGIKPDGIKILQKQMQFLRYRGFSVAQIREFFSTLDEII